MNITTANLGWWITGFLVAGTVLGALQEQIRDRWEITRGSRLPVRRWYGPGSHVCLRADEDAEDAHRYLVTDWDDDGTEVPYLKAVDIDDEDAAPGWAPVTVFAPYSVRRFRPHLLRVPFRGRAIPVPQLRAYLPLRNPSGHLEEVPDAA